MTLKPIINGMNNSIFSSRKAASTLTSRRMLPSSTDINAIYQMVLSASRIT